MTRHLRPVEKRVVAMRDNGVEVAEIARRLKRSDEHIERMLTWIDIPRSSEPSRDRPSPLARRVLAMRSEGLTHTEIADKFKRSPEFIRQVEGMAHYRRGLELLS